MGLWCRLTDLMVKPMQRYLFAALIAAAVPLITTAPAAEWPARPIKIIAPSTPGGAADTFARLLAEVLPPQLHTSPWWSTTGRAAAG